MVGVAPDHSAETWATPAPAVATAGLDGGHLAGQHRSLASGGATLALGLEELIVAAGSALDAQRREFAPFVYQLQDTAGMKRFVAVW